MFKTFFGDVVSLSFNHLDRVASGVQQHVLVLHGFWRSYRKLFRGNAYSAPILREAAGEFFWLVERALKASVLQSFRQLTDGTHSMGKPNASFHGLLLAAAGADYLVDHPDLVAIANGITAKPTIRDHVNRYIAHLDLPLLAGQSPAPASLAIAEVEEALAATREFMNEFMSRFLGRAAFDYEAETEILAAQIDSLVELVKAGQMTTRDA